MNWLTVFLISVGILSLVYIGFAAGVGDALFMLALFLAGFGTLAVGMWLGPPTRRK